MSIYTYTRSEPSLWTVGYHDPDGQWEPDSDHGSQEEAAARVHWLNGGSVEVPVTTELAEMPATGLDVGQQIRLETARLLMEDWHSIAADKDDEDDATIGAFTRDMLCLAAAIETGAEPARNQDRDGAADGEVR